MTATPTAVGSLLPWVHYFNMTQDPPDKPHLPPLRSSFCSCKNLVQESHLSHITSDYALLNSTANYVHQGLKNFLQPNRCIFIT